MAIVQSANGFARAFSAPLSQMLIDGFGWRGAYLAQGGFMAVGSPAADRAVQDVATRIASRSAARAQDERAGGRCVRRCARRISGCCRWSMCSPGSAVSWWRCTSLPSPSTIGFDKLYAAEVLGLGAFLSLPGVIITGWVSDYIGRELSAVITYGTSIIGVACALLITSPDQHLLLWLHSCFFGLTWGARGPAITAKTAELFPGPRLGTILGAITIGTGIGSASGSWLAGWSFDVTGSYHLAFWLSIFFYACGSVAFWMLRRPPRRQMEVS